MRILIILLFILLAMPAAAQNKAVPVRAGVHDTYNRLVFDWDRDVKFDISQQDGQATIIFDNGVAADLVAAAKTKTPLIRDLSQRKVGDSTKVTFRIPNGASVKAFRLGKKIALDVTYTGKTPPVFADAKPAKPAPDKPAEKAEEKPPQVPPVAAAVPVQQTPAPSRPQTLADLLAGQALQKTILQPPDDKAALTPPLPPEETIDGTLITLSSTTISRLAAFVRAGKLWLVIDRTDNDLRPVVVGVAKNELQNVTKLQTKDGTAFLFDLPDSQAKLFVTRKGNDWRVNLNPTGKFFAAADLPVSIQTRTPQRVALYAGESPVVITIKDPVLGQKLWIVPVRAPLAHSAAARQINGLAVLPTVLGAALAPNGDQLRIAPEQDLVVVTSADQNALLLSDDADRKTGALQAERSPLFVYAPLRPLTGKNFDARRQQLEKALVLAKTPPERTAMLFDLARLNIGAGYGPEALGLLRMAAMQQNDVTASPEFAALHGVAASLAHDMATASDDLNDPRIQSQPQASLWLGYNAAQAQDWLAARAAFLEAGNAADRLPLAMRSRVLIAQADTALQAGDLVTVDGMLKKLDAIKDKPTPTEQAGIAFVQAGVLLAKGQDKNAAPLYEQLADGKDNWYRVRAEMALIDTQLKTKAITVPQAIERLGRSRFSWRGDRLEVQIMRRLGQAYIDNRQYGDGLSIWRQAASLATDAADIDAITADMQQEFNNLYVKGDGDAMQPLQAVALFQQFRELTPTGADGSVALMRLADRLASVDLLDQADDLLANQILKQAQGHEAFALGAKLATIRIHNGKPADALKILDETDQSDGDVALVQRRHLLRARAMTDSNMTDDALALLASDTSEAALSLKADINWRQSRWNDVTSSLQDLLLYHRNQGNTAADGPIPSLVLKMAIAMTLDNNPKGLALLNTQYGDFMATTKSADAFKLITQPQGTGALADLDTLKTQVGQVELFEKFLKDF